MKKSIQFFLLSLFTFLSLFSIIDESYNQKIIIESEVTNNTKISKEEARELIKEAAFSLMQPHLQQSLKQAVEQTVISSKDVMGFPAVCFAPDTDQEVIDAFYENQATIANSLGVQLPGQTSKFNLTNRWPATALDGGGLGQGDITTLTWSYVPDGTAIGNGGCGVGGESNTTSDFIAFFNGIYGGPTVPGDFTTAPWHDIFVSMYASWSNVSGLIFVYEPNDDGATVVTGGDGVLGVRGDMRISGRALDGNSGVLACNYFPGIGDMIIDTSDNFFSVNPGLGTSNVLTHEVGHGLGILHVCPVVQSKLMEPFISFAFQGPQEDDILAVNRSYGDPEGVNDSPATATFFGSSTTSASYSRTQRSIDDNEDVDYFSFTTTTSTTLNGTLSPTGTTYLSDTQNNDGSCNPGSPFNALTVSNLQFEVVGTDGVSVLATANVNGPGVNETLTDIILPFGGTYYIRVSQQGGAVNNVQMYDLSFSVDVPTTPEIAFEILTGNGIENSDCSSTDYTIDLILPVAASANADVTFSVDAASTAAEGVDFDLLTPSVTFPSGSTTNQSITLRIYEDGFVEGNETIVITTLLDANGGDATLNNAADTFTFTIVNDDEVPTSNSNDILYFEDFDDGDFEVVTTNNSGQGTDWGVGDSATADSGFWNTTGNTSVFAFTNDDACDCDLSNSQLITDPIDLSGSYNSATLSFDHAFADVNTEDADVLISIDNGATFTEVLNLTNTSINNGGGNFTTPWVNGVTVDLTPYQGNTQVLIAFRYNDGGNWLYGMAVDNIEVTASSITNVQTAVNSTTPDQVNLSGTGTVYALDPASGNIIAGIVNNDSFNYGCTDVSVSRAGNGSQSFNGSVSPDLVLDKTFTLTPSSTTTSGSNTVTFYFEQPELDNWLTTTGLTVNDIVAARVDGSSVTEIAILAVDAFGSNVTLSGDFTGINGTYYFGTLNAFSLTCSGGLKTWNGTSWLPSGDPDDTHQVVINGNYDTGDDGNLVACSLIINNGFTLTIDANTFISIEGNINVTGTLQVNHLGSVVQTDDTATVSNNGIINVNLDTPELKPRDIIFLGSPMTTETNTGVFNDADRLGEHVTANFVPHPDVTDQFPLAENFADDNFNDYLLYTGILNPGEGYGIRPRPITATGNEIYSVTFAQGTLNNGVVTYNVDYNEIIENGFIDPVKSKAASYNLLANPYASAIDATEFINENPTVSEVYFWEHVLSPSAEFPGGNDVNFSMQDISMFNVMGGTAAPNEPSSTPNGFIGTGQGFGIKANSAGVASFNNTMRVTTNEEVRALDSNTNRLWLEVSNNEYQLQGSTLIGFTENATAGFDDSYDSNRIATAVSIYSHLITQDNQEKELGIQSREAFDFSQELLLGFSTLVDEYQNYTISVKDLEGSQVENATVYLMDLQENIKTNLSETNYTFSATKGTFNERFILSFQDRNILDTNTFLVDTVKVYPNPTEGELTIVSPQSSITAIRVTDIQGRAIVTQSNLTTSQYQLSLSAYNTGIYFVNIKTEKGTVTKRIIKR